MDRTRWLIFGGVCIAIIAGLVASSRNDRIDVSAIDAAVITNEREINDQVFGNRSADIVVFEYADFQCPGCGGAFANLQTIKSEYKDSIAFVYRHFPLLQSHPHAFAAAAAAESAGLQGKFWEMHDLIYQSQQAWSSMTSTERQAEFERYAESIGLNMEQYRNDLASKKVADKVNFDRALGVKVGVDSTPSLYIGSEKVSSDTVTDVIQQQGDTFRDLLDEKIREAGGQPPQREQAQ